MSLEPLPHAQKVYRRKGLGIENHVLVEEPLPKPGYGQVLVRIYAFSLNFRDLLLAWGKYPVDPALSFGIIPISDGAGQVVQLGEGVHEVKVGDRVTPNFVSSWVAGELDPSWFASSLGGTVDGVAGQYIVANANSLVLIPGHLSYEEAATLPCAAVTAWNALFEGPTPIRVGESVLVEGTGGVSIFALQFAASAGARVIVTSSKDDKLKKAKGLGALDGINYKEDPDWEKTVIKLTEGRGVDHIVEVGGADTVPKAVVAVRTGGHIYPIGGVTGFDVGYNNLLIVIKALHIRGLFVGSAEMFKRMNAAISLHKIHPHIDKVFEFDDLQGSLKYLEKGEHFGKVVVRVVPHH